jgi:hypothetical protein
MTFVKIGEILSDVKIKYTYKEASGQELERTYTLKMIEEGIAKCDKGEVVVKRELLVRGKIKFVVQTPEEEILEIRATRMPDIILPDSL